MTTVVAPFRAGVSVDIACPFCGEPMILRTRKTDGAKFYGCSEFPSCKGTRRYTEPSTKKFTPSKYQLTIFEWIVFGKGHAVVGAVAGSGKTTTCVQGLEYVPYSVAYGKGLFGHVPVTEVLPLLTKDQITALMERIKVAFVAFNKHIARELSQKAPEYVHVSTLHSLGYANIRAALGNVKVDEFKVKHIINEIANRSSARHPEFATKVSDNLVSVTKLVALCKATLLPPTRKNLEYLSDRYSVDLNDSERHLFITTRIAFYASIKQRNVIDYEDMIYFSAVDIVPCQKFDFLFCDEVQDFNKAQTEMALKSVTQTGRIAAVGDRWQSLYGFRAADVDAIPNIIKALDATVLPLSITYRCPKSHVKLAKTLVREIEASDTAKDGIIDTIPSRHMANLVKPKDMVICRTNAPLVGPAFELIAQGIKATIRGRDIGTGLIELIHKVQKRQKNAVALSDLLAAITNYIEGEMPKLLAAEKNIKAQMLQDQLDTIVALSSGCYSVKELEGKIESIFSDEAEGVVFSSVHRAKGLEADRVFILRPDQMPHPMAKCDWEQQQEANVMYVAYTRSKSELYFVVKEK
jgi:DNA helicase II / ATP-dependent DNA helicase PcrA